MVFFAQYMRPAAVTLVVAAVAAMVPALAAPDVRAPCTEDAMLVFDASGSMSGNGWGYGSENPQAFSLIDKVRLALAKVLPPVTRMRRVGLITYGPDPYDQCTTYSLISGLPQTRPNRSSILCAA